MAEKKKNLWSLRFPEFLLVFLLVISGVLLGFNSGGFVVNFSRIGFSILSSIENGMFAVVDGVKQSVNSVNELFKLRNEYNELVSRMDEFEMMRRSNAEIRGENERLRELLGFSQSIAEENFPAQIIARDIDRAYASITINKGAAHGIEKNMPVVAYQNGMMGLVGKVTQVGKYTSTVLPIYNLNCSVSARIRSTRDIGLVTGLGVAEVPLLLQYIRSRVSVSIGEIIVTSGENDNYLPDIPIGTVKEIRGGGNNSSYEIDITPVIDFPRLEHIIVIKPNYATEAGK